MKNKKFNFKNKVLIIAEIGNNHEGSFKLAKRLIEKAAKAGVDAVKFQTFKTEKYVNDNKQTILNATSVDHFYNIMFLPWKIDNISFEEKWSLYKDIPFQELINMKLFIDKHEIILTKKQVEELGIKINFQGLEEYLSEKRFSFLLEKINDQEILPQQSEKYYKNLLTKDWNHIK